MQTKANENVPGTMQTTANENVPGTPSDIGCLTDSGDESDKISFGEETSEAERHKIKSTSQNMLIRRMHQ
jgi:hypothetical protein